MIRIILILLLFVQAALANDANPTGNRFSYDVATPCDQQERNDGGEITSNSLDEKFQGAACGIGESFNVKTTFIVGSANAWTFAATTLTDDSNGTNNKECFEYRAVAWANGSDMTTNQASNTAVAGDQITNPGTKTRFVPATADFSNSSLTIKNHNGNTNCTGSPSSCEYGEVTVNVKRIACASNDVASDVWVRTVHINQNP